MARPIALVENFELNNNQVVHKICKILDELAPKANGISYQDQITFVEDRKGHDRRYAIDASKIEKELNHKNIISFEAGINELIMIALGKSAHDDF